MKTQTNTDDLLRYDERSGSKETQLFAEVSKIHPAELAHVYVEEDGAKYYEYSLVRVHQNPDVYIRKSYKGPYYFCTYMNHDFCRSLELPTEPRKMHKLNLKALKEWIDYTILVESLKAAHEVKKREEVEAFEKRLRDAYAGKYGGKWHLSSGEYNYTAEIDYQTGHIFERITFNPKASTLDHFLTLTQKP